MDPSAKPPLTLRNPVYRPASLTQARYRFLIGGSDSGKSVFIAQDYLADIAKARPFRLLVLRKTLRTCRRSTFALFIDIIKALGRMDEVSVNHTEMSIVHGATGNEILHAGLDDVEKLKSYAGITDIWFEEATEGSYNEKGEHDFEQVDLRLRGPQARQLTCSLNPGAGFEYYAERFGFDIGTFPPLRGHDELRGVFVQHTTYLDNPHADHATAARVYAYLPESMRLVYEKGLYANTDAPDQLISYALWKQATELDPEVARAAGGGLFRLGVDIAWTGDDDSAIAYLDGYYLTDLMLFHGQDPTRTGNMAKKAIVEDGYSAELTAVDDIGMGSTVKSNLWTDGYNVQGFTAGASAVPWRDPMPEPMKEMRFTDLRSQAWYFLRCLMETGRFAVGDLPSDVLRKLKADVLAPRYRYKEKGLVQVEPKQGTSKLWGIKARIGRSTDPGDAVVMGLFAEFIEEERGIWIGGRFISYRQTRATKT